MKELTLYVYKVGHGVFTLLHGTQDDDSPFNAVFDCGFQPFCCGEDFNNGVALDSHHLTFSAIRHAADIILYGGNRKLDYLVCSHQDIDHNNLIMTLLTALNQIDKPLESVPWFRTDSGVLINGYEHFSKTICIGKGQRLIYKFEDELLCGKCNITQTVFPSEQGADTYVNTLHAEVVNTKFKPNDTPLDGVLFLFIITVDAGIVQEGSGKTESIVQSTKVNITAAFYGINVFSFDWKTDTQYTLSCWYDGIICESNAQLCNKFKEEYYQNAYSNVLKSLQYWLNSVGTNFFKAGGVIYESLPLIDLYKRQFPTVHPSFGLGTVIMGGCTNKKKYETLCNFLKKYMKEIVPFGTFYRNLNYAYADMDSHRIRNIFNVDIEMVANEAGKESYDEENEKFIFNATSTVVNFIYYDSHRNAHSVLFPGDITAHRHIDVAEKVNASKSVCSYIIAPHHGSLHTNFIKNGDGELIPKNSQPLYSAYVKLGHNIITIISECFNNYKYCTPCAEFFDIVSEFAPEKMPLHSVPVFTDDKDENSRTIKETTRGVYLMGMFSEDYCAIPLISGNELAAPLISEPADKPARVLPPDELFV